jgi:hypothetical protein
MNDLLRFVLEAHGGLRRWSGVSALTAKPAAVGAVLEEQRIPGAVGDQAVDICTRRQHAVLIAVLAHPSRRLGPRDQPMLSRQASIFAGTAVPDARRKPANQTAQPENRHSQNTKAGLRCSSLPKGRSPVRPASHGDEIVHGCEAAQQAAGEPLLYARLGAHRAWPGIEAAEPHRWTGEPIASGRSHCRSRGRLEVVPARYRAARGGPRLTDHNPQETPAALAPARGSSVPRARLLWAAALLLLEAIADDAPGDPDASELALERMGAPEIAAELYLSANTVKTHLRHLYRKLGAHSRQEAVQRARAIGLLTASYRRP